MCEFTGTVDFLWKGFIIEQHIFRNQYTSSAVQLVLVLVLYIVSVLHMYNW